jgi:hypothetical protein
VAGAASAQIETPGAISANASSDTASSTNAAPTDQAANPSPTPAKRKPLSSAAQLQIALDQLTQTNRDLLDLMKKQQGVLQDMQFDRRLQSRQIELLEERLTDTAFQNAQLQKQIAVLEADAARPQPPPSPPAPTTPATNVAAATPPPTPDPDNPPPPASYLPPAGGDGPPGQMSWHRLFTLKGDHGQQSDLFHVDGRTWRVLWHNQDKPGKTYANTSALFINAYPKDDTIPQKVCAKLGTGGDSTELEGPGNYYLKIEASGGSWELAVEDFR